MLIFQNFHVWFIAKIWLILPMVDCQFGYITKLTKKITGGPSLKGGKIFMVMVMLVSA